MDMEKIFSEAMKLQQNLSDTQAELNEKKYEMSMGGGALRVCAKGSMEIESIEIDDDLMKQENKEDLQDLLISCINQALNQAKKDKEQEMKSMTAGMSIPGVF